MANQKLVYINDQEVWKYICQLNNFSAWVRDKARAEMQGGIDPGIAIYIEELLSRRLVGRAEPVVMPVISEDLDHEICGFL
ncbi:hypothetical protein [Pelosinus sp. UFO1]|uniref:hypothetical protein n=1 Tax=Pelosinus sp. UFO1 TaxID=484770 RepID=UPI0004D16F58|nr:hypothetical protein [Pelosinus sp. UFO1]AIF51982.1 hypothetical protein UFO1_2435 [Pelosinus sp. UFO1]